MENEAPPGCPIVEDPEIHHKFMRHYNTNPPIWKDWVGIVGMIGTVAVVLLQGGRILERLDVSSTKLTEIAVFDSKIYEDMFALKSELMKQRGVDAIHEEQIKNLDGRVVTIERRPR